MRQDQARIALADAMQLHDERVSLAKANVDRLRMELEGAEIRLGTVRQARENFVRYIVNPTTTPSASGGENG